MQNSEQGIAEVKIDSEKSALTKDIPKEYDHLMDFFNLNVEKYGSGLPYLSPDSCLFCHQISGHGFKMLILTLVKMGLKLLLNIKLVSCIILVTLSCIILVTWNIFSFLLP